MAAKPQAGIAGKTRTFREKQTRRRLAGRVGTAAGEGPPVFVPYPSRAQIDSCPDRVRPFAPASADAING